MKRENLLIFTFTLLAFILGTTEYVIVGLLTPIASSLGVSVAQTGIMVSGFAIAYAAGTPFVMMAAGYFTKRRALLLGASLVVLFTMGSALSFSYPVLFLTRMATAVFCGLSVSLAVSICTDYVSPERRGLALSYIIGGFTIANVLGVPIGTFVGLHFEWPAAFWLVAACGIISLLLLYRIVPKDLPAVQSSLKNQFRLMTNPRVLLAFFIPIIGVAAIFVIYTYINPLMLDVMHISEERTSTILLVYGAVTIVSNILGGKIASGTYVAKLKTLFLVHAVVYVIFGFTLSFEWLGIVSLMAIALISFSINAACQLYFIHLTEQYVPEAKDFASSLLPISANIGIAVGSSIGAFVTDHYGLRYLPWAAVVLALLAFAATAYSYSLDRSAKKAALQAAG
ncbi:putative MFS family arabinose efflux permease [Paenibacillus sp. BK033]|uniref:MFS transporter n=1 Tax=Paenibacillus sp. BK033 TaxID=2512133 RepID=UPI001048A697|nr:MFS transporter [Paenibacillus sp. BK033]TCN00736.1 putative MFS family arabinose efflux permease [Paenibacillus sp. BK033]